MSDIISKIARTLRQACRHLSLATKDKLGVSRTVVRIHGGMRLSVRHDDIFARVLLFGSIPEVEVQRQLIQSARQGMTVLDIGANIGYYTTILANAVGKGGRVFAFEPNPTCYAELCRNLELNKLRNVSSWQIALGEKDEAGLLQLPGLGRESHSSLQGNATFQSTGTVAVAIRSLDGFLADQNCSAVNLVKCDVEGAELQVLQGAKETLRRFRPVILMELDPRLLSSFGTKPEQILELLAGLGYSHGALSEHDIIARC